MSFLSRAFLTNGAFALLMSLTFPLHGVEIDIPVKLTWKNTVEHRYGDTVSTAKYACTLEDVEKSGLFYEGVDPKGLYTQACEALRSDNWSFQAAVAKRPHLANSGASVAVPYTCVVHYVAEAKNKVRRTEKESIYFRYSDCEQRFDKVTKEFYPFIPLKTLVDRFSDACGSGPALLNDIVTGGMIGLEKVLIGELVANPELPPVAPPLVPIAPVPPPFPVVPPGPPGGGPLPPLPPFPPGALPGVPGGGG